MPIADAEPCSRAPLSLPLVMLLAAACGLAVANVYYAQPLLDAMAADFGLSEARIGWVVTATQAGYGLGLVLLVPLGDLWNRRRLIVLHLLLLAAALLVVATARSGVMLLAGMALTGLLAVVTQTLVAYAGSLATPDERGRVLGIVTSGVVLGILAARTVAGVVADVGGWRSVYWLAAGASIVTAAAMLRLLPNEPSVPVAPPTRYRALIRSVFTLFAEVRELRVRASIALLLFMAFNILWTPLALLLSAPPLSLSHTANGAFGLIGIVGALAAVRAGALADRGHGERVTGASLLLLLVSWIAIAAAPQSLLLLTAGIVVLDLAVQAVHVTNQSQIYKVRPEARSRLTAGYMLFYAIGSGLGSAASTAAYAYHGWLAVSMLGAGTSALGLLVWALSLRAGRPTGDAMATTSAVHGSTDFAEPGFRQRSGTRLHSAAPQVKT